MALKSATLLLRLLGTGCWSAAEKEGGEMTVPVREMLVGVKAEAAGWPKGGSDGRFEKAVGERKFVDEGDG